MTSPSPKHAASAEVGRALLASLAEVHHDDAEPSVKSLLHAPHQMARRTSGDSEDSSSGSPAWIVAMHKALQVEDPWKDYDDLRTADMERALEHVFDPESHKWSIVPATVKCQTKPFANGALRRCFRIKKEDSPLEDLADKWIDAKDKDLATAVKGIGHATARRFTVAAGLPDELGVVVAAFRGPDREHYLTMLKDLLYNAEQREAVLQRLSAYCRLAAEHERSWLHAPNFVIKEYMEDGATRDDYIMDVEMQMIAKFWGEQFNLSNPPKKVDVLRASLIEFPDRPGSPIYACEAFMEGDYVKYNSNSGYVSEIGRVTPQAFSHFTFVASKGQLMVIDIQGVNDLYTDPQIHTVKGEEFGNGNLGASGMARFFASHKCSPLCDWLGLPHIGLSPAQIERVEAADGSSPAGVMATLTGAGAGAGTSAGAASPAFSDAPSDSPGFARSVTLPPSRLPFRADSFTKHSSLGAPPTSAGAGRPEQRNPPGVPRHHRTPTGAPARSSNLAPSFKRAAALAFGTGTRNGVGAGAGAGAGTGTGTGTSTGGSPKSKSHGGSTKQPPSTIAVPPEPEGVMDLRRALSTTRRAVSLSSVSPYLTPPASPELKAMSSPKRGPNPDHSMVYDALGRVHLALAKHHAAGEYSDRTPDFESARFHLQKSAAKGNLTAICALANVYQGLPNDVVPDLEDHVEPDDDKVKSLRKMAADLGDRDSMVTAAKAAADEGNVSEALKLYLRVLEADASSGVSDASRSALDTKTFDIEAAVGDILLVGGPGVPPDAEAAAEHFDAAQNGAMAHPSGQRKYMKYSAKYEEAMSQADTVSSGAASGGIALRLA